MSSSACYCDTGHPSMWSSSRTYETHTCCQAFSSGAITFCFYDLGLSQIPTPNLPHARRTLLFTDSDTNAVCHAVSSEKRPIINRTLTSYNIFSYAKSPRGDEYRVSRVYFPFCFLFLFTSVFDVSQGICH